MSSLTCQEVQPRWAEYLYREMDEPDRALFAQHLQRCPQCSAEEAEWRRVFARFDGIAAMGETLEVPSELVFRVKRQIQLYEDWSLQTRSQFRNALMGAAAAVFLLIGGGWMAWRHVPSWMPQAEIIQPYRESVLSRIYDRATLDVLQSEGILPEKAADEPEVVIRQQPTQKTKNEDTSDTKSNPT